MYEKSCIRSCNN